jgi:hypothetical protein
MAMSQPLITPDTRVAELLDRWPQLEDVLLAQAPAFAKLRNPVLRRTVARVATLAQAAAIAGLHPRDLVLTLRRAVGQPVDEGLDEAGGRRTGHACSAADPGPVEPLPAWATARPPAAVVDLDTLLAANEVPLKRVFDEAARLGPGDLLELRVSFQPVPLIERLQHHGYRCAVGRTADGRIAVIVAAA